MRKRVCGFLIGLLMSLVGCGGTITDNVCEEEWNTNLQENVMDSSTMAEITIIYEQKTWADDMVISFTDQEMLSDVRKHTGITECEITYGDVKNIKEFEGGFYSDLSSLMYFTSLQELTVFGTAWSDEGGYHNLNGLENLTNLRSLTVANSDSLTDISAIWTLRNLESLTIDNCDNLTDLSVLRELPNLQSLEILYCDGIVDLDALNGSSLESLLLSNCKNIKSLDDLPKLHTLTIWSCNSFDDLGTLPNLQKIEISGCDLIEEELFVDTIEAQSVLAYDSWTEFKDEWELPYADEETFSVLKEAYANVDFFGEFKEGNESVCEEYKSEFIKMLQNEAPFLDKRTGERICIKDYGRFENGYDVNEYTYYFFDVDEDENNTPELVVRNSAGEMDIFRYDAARGECVLWCDLENCWYSLLGSRKVMWPWDGKYLAFYKINSEGGTESVTFGISNWYSEQQSLHMVVMPELTGVENKEFVTEEMKAQGVYERSSGRWYFRVTEKQYEELMEEYWQAYELAEEKIEGVTYTYEELFGEKNPKDIVAECEAEYGCEFEILDKEAEVDLHGVWQVKELVGCSARPVLPC